MPTTTWKARERQVARYFGEERTPMSGGSSRHTRSDTLHKLMFAEQKHRKDHPVIRLWDEAKAKAKKKNLIPIVLLRETDRPDLFVLVHSDHMPELARQANALSSVMIFEESKEMVLQNKFFISKHQRKKYAAVTLLDSTKDLAKKEDKVPTVTMSVHRRPGFWFVVHVFNLQKLVDLKVEADEQKAEAI